MTVIPLIDSSNFLSSYDTLIFDADGVLWLFKTPIPGAPELVNHLIDIGKQVIILTNNPTNTIDEYVKKVNALGFHKIKRENIVSSGIVMSYELVKRKKNDYPIYLIGTPALKQTIEEVGIDTLEIGSDHAEDYTSEIFLGSIDTRQKISAVVASYDIHFNYIKLMKAVNYLKDPSVDFLVTEEDIVVPGPNLEVIIPCTSISRTISGRKPIVTGKPSTTVYEYIREKVQINPKRTLMIGDNCLTDIRFGNTHGLDTLLVLTGAHKLSDVERFNSDGKIECVPRMYAPSIKTLLAL